MNWMMEVGRDCFAGYPDASDDSQTPFLDILSQTNVYPLQNNLLPFDWDHCRTPNEIGNVDNETQVKHVKGQYSLYSTRLSTASASYIMQGACDPGVSGSTLPQCTILIVLMPTIMSRVVNPPPTNQQIYLESADLGPFLKALFEYYQHYVHWLLLRKLWLGSNGDFPPLQN